MSYGFGVKVRLEVNYSLLFISSPDHFSRCQVLMPNILDVICSEGSILDGLDDWSRSMTRNEWFRITRELVQQTIADMDLDPEAMSEVEEAFIGAGLL